ALRFARVKRAWRRAGAGGSACGWGQEDHAARVRFSDAAGLHPGAIRPPPPGGNGSLRPHPHAEPPAPARSRGRREPGRYSGYFRRGSRASRRPSPKRLKPRTVTKMAMPGKSEIHGFDWMNATFALRSQPQLGVGGCVPGRRKESVASTMIEVAVPSVVVTMIGARQLGRTWRSKIFQSRTPRARHASMYSFSLMD